MVLRKEELIELLLFISLSLMAQIYIDDIVFGSTSSDFAFNFTEEMKKKFKMSMVGGLNFSLEL